MNIKNGILSPSLERCLQTWPVVLVSSDSWNPQHLVTEAISCQASEAMAHLQACGFIHLDIKPANVLFNGKSFSLQATNCSKVCDLFVIWAAQTMLCQLQCHAQVLEQRAHLSV